MPAVSLSGQTKQRQIVLIAVGGLLLAGLLLFQVPRTMKMLKSDAAPPPQQTTATTPTPAPPVATPGATPVPVTTTASVQAASLTRFRSKDPFVQQINPNASSSAAPASESSPPAPAASESTGEAGSFTAVGSAAGTAAGSSTATIAVNGAEETVSVSKTFPEGNPVFKLASVGTDTAKVGVASGTLKGSQTVTLTKGEPLTLLNTVDGKRYRLELISVSS
jgi:hypothetical protein